MRLAGVDIGTLTCRLLIADVDRDFHLHILESDRRMLRLGQGVDRHKRLAPEAMARVVSTLRIWKGRMDAWNVENAIAVATSAVREAENREEFVTQVKRETDMEVKVVDGEEEARLALLGIRAGLPVHQSRADLLALDIGGGSTEFILSRREKAPVVVSMEMGVVRFTERFLWRDPPAPDELKKVEQLVYHLTDEALGFIGRPADVTFIGTAGTITTLAAMAQGLETYDPARIHCFLLSLRMIKELEAMLVSRTRTQRVGLPGLEPGREDVIVAGTLILRCVMETLGVEGCVVSEYGLREGILVDLAQRRVGVQMKS
ncbi:MAG: Ppx/GppA family phosphatase [Nitrospirae bacterium]|nr:MAG: Ppx/GppA family phosphatase [Nitrospirota bacterium]